MITKCHIRNCLQNCHAIKNSIMITKCAAFKIRDLLLTLGDQSDNMNQFKQTACPDLSFYSFACVCAQSLSCVQLFVTPMDCSLPGSSAHGVFQARILEQVTISSSRGSSQPRGQTHISCVSCTGRQILYH